MSSHKPEPDDHGDPAERDRLADYVDTGSRGDGAVGTHRKRGSGGRKHIGRKPGVPNRFTRVMREAALIAAETSDLSSDGTLVSYLRTVANQYPETFTRAVLARLIPYRVDLDLRTQMSMQSSDDIKAELKKRGIDIDRIFKVPQVLSPGTPLRSINPVSEHSRDEDRLDRERVADEARLDHRDGPDNPYSRKPEPVRDVRNCAAAIASPSLDGWHTLDAQPDLPMDYSDWEKS
jgi:hypothetical protein